MSTGRYSVFLYIVVTTVRIKRSRGCSDCIPVCTASSPTRLGYSLAPLWERQIPHISVFDVNFVVATETLLVGEVREESIL